MKTKAIRGTFPIFSPIIWVLFILSSLALIPQELWGQMLINGAGATFPQPLYAKWIADYAAKTGVHINYQGIGSGGGVKNFTQGTVDFGASDAPMTDTEMAGAKGGPIYHIPTVVGVVTLAYNVPELTQPLKLTGAVLGDIYLGKITKWNDTRLSAINPGAKLPAKDILVVHLAGTETVTGDKTFTGVVKIGAGGTGATTAPITLNSGSAAGRSGSRGMREHTSTDSNLKSCVSGAYSSGLFLRFPG